MRGNLPPIDMFIGMVFDRFPRHEILEHIDSGFNGRLYRAHDPETKNSLAFKIVPVENLPEDKGEQQAYLNEAKKANQLEHPSVISCIDVFLWDENEITPQFVVFVSNFIRGQNLREYIRTHSGMINVTFIETFLDTMLGLLYELEQRGFQHGDLHAGNVLVTVPEFDFYGQPQFRVTDFGVHDLTGQTSHANDYLYLADILKHLLEQVDYVSSDGRDRFLYDILRNDFLARHLIETDLSADQYACNPREMLIKLNSVDELYSTEKKEPVPTLQSPFDYPNCEQIGDSHLLLKNLYSDRLLGLAEIQNRSNLILTGPRGCGKTTVFRALSLEYLTSTESDAPEDIKYIGVYYRCDDLYFSFPRYKTPDRSEAQDVPMHYLTVSLIAITLEQIARWSSKYFASELRMKEERLVASLWQTLDWNAPTDPSANKITTLIHRLNKERKRAADKQRFVHDHSQEIRGYFGPGVFFEVCRRLRTSLSYLNERHLYFFIDDYSHPKITKDLQANLNRLVMHRSQDAFFKLSTESPVSFAREDIDGKKYVESREYDLLNLGLRYISSDSRLTLMFLEDLFARRFRQVENYPVKNLEDLIGSFPRNENETAREFRSRGGRSNYAGKETIAAMCSGDIHYVIRLVRSMVEDFGGEAALTEADSVPRISSSKQHKSIRSAAGSFMESVRTIPKFGRQLADIISAFGTVAHSYLLYEDSQNQTGNPPHQLSRIEPYEPLELQDEAQQILEELLRYSILIEDPRGKSRRNKIVPRFYLRRYLIPHFRLTFSHRDSLELENYELDLLFCNPTEFEKRCRLKSQRSAKRKSKKRNLQRDLFIDESD